MAVPPAKDYLQKKRPVSAAAFTAPYRPHCLTISGFSDAGDPGAPSYLLCMKGGRFISHTSDGSIKTSSQIIVKRLRDDPYLFGMKEPTEKVWKGLLTAGLLAGLMK